MSNALEITCLRPCRTLLQPQPPPPLRNATARIKGAGNQDYVQVDPRYLVAAKSSVLTLHGVLLPGPLPAMKGNEQFEDESGSASGSGQWAMLTTSCTLLAMAVSAVLG
jgi:hypothetical protein